MTLITAARTLARAGAAKPLLLSPLCNGAYGTYSSCRVRSVSTDAQQTTEASGALSWKEFFELRQRRQRVEQLSMIPGVGGSLAAAGYVLLGMEVDPSQTIMGVDPLAINALCMIGAGGLGFLVGPSLGNLIWKAANKGLVRKMESREDELLRRVVKHRSPSNLHSIRNPIPDYYGENIKSVESYRTWLRRQREHTRRATFHIGEGDAQ